MKPTSTAALLLLLSSLAFSHGGRLNSEGCHNDRLAGDYHCHRAEPASPNNKGFAVSRVIDGDTVEVIQNGNRDKVRLKEIDAPEMSQPGGAASKNQLQRLIKGRQVQLRGTERDRYQRVLAEIFVGEKNINKQMVSLGHAWAYTRYQTDPSYTALERSARNARAGLWRDESPVPPWDWRRGKRGTPQQLRESAVCGAKRYCREMDSCEEARHYLSQCGVSSLDGDKDGVPCEKICGSNR